MCRAFGASVQLDGASRSNWTPTHGARHTGPRFAATGCSDTLARGDAKDGGRHERSGEGSAGRRGPSVNDFVNTTLAALAIVVQAAAVLLAVAIVAGAVSPRVRASLVPSWSTAGRQSVWVAWFVAAVAMGGSLFFSLVEDFTPCQLCWYQRIAMYPLAIILLVGALLRDRRVSLYAAVFPVVGALISIYHIYIEVNPEKESASCKAGIPCSTRWIDEFGYVTIPVMALSAFVLIALLLVVSFIASRHPDGEPVS